YRSGCDRRGRAARDGWGDCRHAAPRLRGVPGRRGMTPLLAVQDLTVVFDGSRTSVTAVDHVSFQLAAGETLGLVGESGSGKSVTAFSILRLVQPPGRIVGGRVMFEGRDLLALSEPDMRKVR